MEGTAGRVQRPMLRPPWTWWWPVSSGGGARAARRAARLLARRAPACTRPARAACRALKARPARPALPPPPTPPAALPIIPEVIASTRPADTTAVKWTYLLRLLRLSRVFRLLKVQRGTTAPLGTAGSVRACRMAASLRRSTGQGVCLRGVCPRVC